MDTQEHVKRFIVENFYVSDPGELTPETSLISSGYVDSTGMLELMSFLETTFAIHIEEYEATPDNLETIARIAAFLQRKNAAPPSPQPH